MFDREEWLEKARAATREYAAHLRMLEQMEAESARLLAAMVHAYQWPEEAAIPSRFDSYGIEEINKRAFGEDLSCELAVAGKTSQTAARYLAGDVALLSECFPQCWERVTTAYAPLWQARRVAQACRELLDSQCRMVDALVAPCLGGVGIKRLTHTITAAVATMEPDQPRRIAQQGSTRFARTGGDEIDPLTGWVHARVDRADAIFLDATLRLLADTLCDQGDVGDLDQRRARALGMLANPAAVVQLLGVHTTRGMDPVPATEDDKSAFVRHTKSLVPKFTPRAHVYVHMSSENLWEPDEVVRAEGIGPILVDQISSLTKGCRTKVTPVVHLDPTTTMGSDAYEIPDWIRQHVALATPYDVFPWSTIESRHLDLDHTIPYQEGVPNQTTPSNLGPLSRRAHRIKTHAGWRLEQPAPGTYEWVSGAGQRVCVDQWRSHYLVPRVRNSVLVE